MILPLSETAMTCKVSDAFACKIDQLAEFVNPDAADPSNHDGRSDCVYEEEG